MLLFFNVLLITKISSGDVLSNDSCSFLDVALVPAPMR